MKHDSLLREGVGRGHVKNVAIMVAVMAILSTGLVSSAAAASDPVSTFAMNNMPLLLVITVLTGATAFFVKGIGKRNRSILTFLAVLTGALLILGLVGGAPGNGGGQVVGDPIAWNVVADGTLATGADVATEILDSQGATACDGGTPDLNGAIATWGTNGFIDEQSRTLSLMSDSDDDVARSATGFQEIDCPTAGFNIDLTLARDVNGDGTADAVTYFGQLVSIGPATFNDGNLTTSNVLFYDPDFGWECGWFTEGSEWKNAFGDVGRFQQPTAPSSGPWVAIGTNSGPGAASEEVVFACVFDATQGSPAGYTIPSAAGGVVWHATIAIGSPEDPHTYTLNWVLQTRT